MKNLVRKMDGMLIGAQLGARNLIQEVVRKEDGDTNFVSIGIVLVIVALIGGAFVTFGKNFNTSLSGKFSDILNLFN